MPAPPVGPATVQVEEMTQGVRAASRLIASSRRRHHPGFWARIRTQLKGVQFDDHSCREGLDHER